MTSAINPIQKFFDIQSMFKCLQLHHDLLFLYCLIIFESVICFELGSTKLHTLQLVDVSPKSVGSPHRQTSSGDIREAAYVCQNPLQIV
jgi:hypothetical protein